VFGDHLCDFFIGVVQVPEDPGPPRADLDAGRFQASVDPVLAEVALLDDRNQGIDISGIVRAGGKTILASDTAVFVDDDDAVFPLPGCLDRAVDDAGRTITLVAEAGEKVAGDIGVPPLFDDLHPGAIHAKGNAIFRLAGHRTAVTANAPPEIDDHGISFFVGRGFHRLYGFGFYYPTKTLSIGESIYFSRKTPLFF
jgi:hypothetical protein